MKWNRRPACAAEPLPGAGDGDRRHGTDPRHAPRPLGTAVLLGMGGVTAELFKDTTMRLLPAQGGLSREEALGMAQELKTWPLLDGFRGRPKADVRAGGRHRRVLADGGAAGRPAGRSGDQPGVRVAARARGVRGGLSGSGRAAPTRSLQEGGGAGTCSAPVRRWADVAALGKDRPSSSCMADTAVAVLGAQHRK